MKAFATRWTTSGSGLREKDVAERLERDALRAQNKPQAVGKALKAALAHNAAFNFGKISNQRARTEGSEWTKH